MKHFKLSSKSTCTLNDVLEVMGMKKVHLLTFCPTRMCYLLSACGLSVSLLVPICNVLVSLNIKPESKDYFLSPKSMFILHILADLETPFKKYFLRCLDANEGVIIDIYRINEEFAKHMTTLKFPLFTKYIEGLEMDEHGNLSVCITINESIHDISLNYTHRPSRKETDRLSGLKKEAESVKQEVVTNLIENITDQNQTDSLFEFASAFDLHRPLDLEERVRYIKELQSIAKITFMLSLAIMRRNFGAHTK